MVLSLLGPAPARRKCLCTFSLSNAHLGCQFLPVHLLTPPAAVPASICCSEGTSSRGHVAYDSRAGLGWAGLWLAGKFIDFAVLDMRYIAPHYLTG